MSVRASNPAPDTPVPCPRCHATGTVQGLDCPQCHGTGDMQDTARRLHQFMTGLVHLSKVTGIAVADGFALERIVDDPDDCFVGYGHTPVEYGDPSTFGSVYMTFPPGHPLREPHTMTRELVAISVRVEPPAINVDTGITLRSVEVRIQRTTAPQHDYSGKSVLVDDEHLDAVIRRNIGAGVASTFEIPTLVTFR